MLQNILIVSNALTTLAALLLTLSLTNRLQISTLLRNTALGIAFGLCATITMLQPMQIDVGVQIDGRNLFIGFAGAISGVIGATIALLISIITRVSIGGMGVFPALTGMAICAILGTLWSKIDQRNIGQTSRRWLLFGFLLCLSIPTLMLLPAPQGWNTLVQGGPYQVVIYICGAVLIGFFYDTENSFKNRQENLQECAEIDPLTKALNRRGFKHRYTTQVNSRERKCGVMIALDINNFKSINDQYGHNIGDEVLIALTKKLQSSVRSNDFVGRLGGDEFVLCAFGVAEQQLDVFIEKLEYVSHFEFSANEQCFEVTASVGGTHFDASRMSLSKILDVADANLMAKKKIFHKLHDNRGPSTAA